MKLSNFLAFIFAFVVASITSRKIRSHNKKKYAISLQDREIPCTYSLTSNKKCEKYDAECDFKWNVCRRKDGAECHNDYDEMKTGCLSKSKCIPDNPDTKWGKCRSNDSLKAKLVRTANALGFNTRDRK